MQRVCQVCQQPYGENGRNPREYGKSKFCSLKCSGVSQRANLDDVLRRTEVNPITGCRLWQGYKLANGYGQTKFDRRNWVVHRLIWEKTNGPVPVELQLDHLCKNKACCNVEHLRVTTAQINTLAGNNMAARYARRIVCEKCGGPFSFFSNGVRYCKPCRHKRMMETQRIRRERLKGEKI